LSGQDFATVLDRRLKRIAEVKAKAIEAKPVIDGEKVDADRRFRRIWPLPDRKAFGYSRPTTSSPTQRRDAGG